MYFGAEELNYGPGPRLTMVVPIVVKMYEVLFFIFDVVGGRGAKEMYQNIWRAECKFKKIVLIHVKIRFKNNRLTLFRMKVSELALKYICLKREKWSMLFFQFVITVL